MFIMLNPSTADALKDDPTIRRCIAYAQGWGYGMLEVVNLFAWRATFPRELALAPDPVGPENDEYLRHALVISDVAICAWGRHGGERAEKVKLLGEQYPLHVLGFNKDGSPVHPLYQKRGLQPVAWPQGHSTKGL